MSEPNVGRGIELRKILMDIFEILESEVSTYCRTWDTVFDRTSGSTLFSEDGRDYLDFFSGPGFRSARGSTMQAAAFPRKHS
jgi:4-aminobutyrate aminotransferase-like enzyme